MGGMRFTGRGVRRALIGAAVIMLLVPVFAAFEAHVINVRGHIENALQVEPAEIDFGVVFPQEHLERDFGIRLSDSFMRQERVTDVFYRLVLAPKPKAPGGSEFYADLRPFVEVSKASEVDTDTPAFAELGNDWWLIPDDHSAGSLRDTEDRWVIDFAVPCIEGTVGQDYAGPVAPAEDDYGMDIRVEVLGFSYGRHLHKIAVGPTQVPTSTRMEWTFYFIVKNDTEATMRDLVLTDRFGAELDALDYYEVNFVYASPGWTFEQSTSKSGQQDRIRWTIDELAPMNRGLLVLTVATKTNPAGKQQYASPGTYTLNSGAVLKWRDAAGPNNSETTEPIEVTAVSP